MTHNSVEQVRCPHWSTPGRRCLLSRAGLYLPVEEHVALFCETAEFVSCPHYTVELDAKAPGENGTGAANRRQWSRVPGRYRFSLARPLDNGLCDVIDESASTVDLSPRGIRCESFRALPVGSRVFFTISGEISDIPLEGRGQVRWCRSLDNAPLYHAGIAIEDPALVDLLQDRLAAA